MSRSNRDHAKKKQRPMVEDQVIASQLEALLTPSITAQENYYRQLGLRDRILNLPLMVAPAAIAFRRATAEKLAGGADSTVARCGWSHGTDKNAG